MAAIGGILERLVAIVAFLLWVRVAGAESFLFDNTKAETAGNADWVIDADNGVSARFPTPPASGITASTPESYWLGALSSWGVALVQRGHTVETLPSGARITYGDGTNAQDLSHYHVYVVCEPNILFTAAEKAAIVNFVLDGGSLFIISDHAGSDRNNDGADSVVIWNDFFTNNGVRNNGFGLAINSNSISLTTSTVDTGLDDPLTRGLEGNVTQLKYSAGATMTIDPARHPEVRAAVWSSSSRGNASVMLAYGRLGSGRFVAIGDSSPSDDGTGSPGNNLFLGWTDVNGDHSRIFLNGSRWLADTGSTGPANDAFASAVTLGGGGGTSITASGFNLSGTKETGEPIHAGNAGGASVWWQFTATVSGTTTISTAGSGFDTLLAVYTGSAVGGLASIAANDNDGSLTTSRVSFAAMAGVTYRIAVDGHDGATGAISLTLTSPTPPAPLNDNFANAAVLPAGRVAVTATNMNATKQTGEPNHGGNSGGKSVWWVWTAPSAGTTTVNTIGSDFDTTLGVYTGTAVNALTTIGIDDDSGGNFTSEIIFNAIAGVTYRIAVDGYNGSFGNIVLAIIPPPLVSVAVTDASARERPLDTGAFTVSLDFAQSQDLTVALNLTGTATPGSDYTLNVPVSGSTASVVIPAGQTSLSIILTPVADDDPTEFDETFLPLVAASASYQSAPNDEAIVIADDTPYTTAWVTRFGSAFRGAVAAPLADPNQNGIVNLLEFAADADPLISGITPSALPLIGFGTFPDPADQNTLKSFPTLTFLRRTDAPALTYSPQFCTNLSLANWSSSGLVQVGVTTEGLAAEIEKVTYRSPSPAHGSTAVTPQFFRLQVTVP